MEVKIDISEVLKPQLEEYFERIIEATTQAPNKPVYTDSELKELLGVSTKTTQTWRFTGKIGYSQIGRTILYSWEDIKTFLENHHNKPLR